MRKYIIPVLLIVCATLLCSWTLPNVWGRVTCGGRGVEGVQVSDGRQIVTTNRHGYYSMRSAKIDSIVFITTPSGYVARRTAGPRPDFFAILRKAPGAIECHSFKLEKQDQRNYSVLFMSDLHFGRVADGIDRRGFADNVYPTLSALTDKLGRDGRAVYCVQLGDFAHDSYWYERNFDERDAYAFLSTFGMKAPIFGVGGNHDSDASVTGHDTDRRSSWQLRRVWGPDRYAMNIGRDHWIFLDDIVYNNTPVDEMKYKNIRGSRDYECRLTNDQLEWLAKDLESVMSGTRIYLCMHCPLLNTANPKESLSEEQVRILDRLFSRFPEVTVYSGHAHMMHMPDGGEFSRFHQYVLPATSGSMWQTDMRGFQSISSDGTDAGIFSGSGYSSDKEGKGPVYEYTTFRYGPKAMRIYDMNTVADYYRSNDDVRRQMSLYSPKYKHDFGNGDCKNMIFINYWMYTPGEIVQVFENGRELVVRQEKYEDPLYNISYFVPESIEAGKFKKSLGSYRWPHMFTAQAHTATQPVVVRVLDKEGRLIREEKLQRPKPFNADIN